jgi:hypothetical protein
MRVIAFLFGITLASTVFSQTASVYLPKVLPHEATIFNNGEVVVSFSEDGMPVGIKVGSCGLDGGVDLIDRRHVFASTPVVRLDPTDYIIRLGGDAYASGKTYQMFPPTTNRSAAAGTITVIPNKPYQIKSVTVTSAGYFYTPSEAYEADRSSYTFTATKNPTSGGYYYMHTCEVVSVSVDAWIYPNAGRTNDCRETPTLISHPFTINPNYSSSQYNLPMTWGAYKTIADEVLTRWSNYDSTSRVDLLKGMRFEDGVNLQQSFDVSYKNNGFWSLNCRDSNGSNIVVLAAENLDVYPCIVNFPDSNTTEIVWTTNGISGGTFVVECTTNYPNNWTTATELTTNVPPMEGYLARTVVNPFGDTQWTTYWRVRNADATVGTPMLRTDLPFHAPSIVVQNAIIIVPTNPISPVVLPSGALWNSNGVAAFVPY